MSPLLLALRTLQQRWGLGALTAFCIAISASVITGALLVGGSVRESLRERFLGSLGSVRYALMSTGLASPSRSKAGAAAALRVEGSASNADETTLGGVQVWGIDDQFLPLAPGPRAVPKEGEAWLTPGLAKDLGVGPGESIFLRVPNLSSPPMAAIFVKRAPTEATVEVSVSVAGVLPADGQALSLEPRFQPSRAAFLDRAWLARQVAARDAANVFLGSEPEVASGFELADDGLNLVKASRAGGWVLQSDRLVLSEDQRVAALSAAKELGVKSAEVSVALCKTVRAGSRSQAYALAAWVDGVPPGINTWAATDLSVKAGDLVSADLLTAESDGGFGSAKVETRVGPILPMTGIGAEPALAPKVKGVTDAGRMDQWDPPFAVDRGRITAKNKKYWDLHRAAPRIFFSREQIAQAWRGSPGITGVWFPDADRGRLETAIASRIFDGATERWKVRPVREEAEAASRGSTDMAMLMLALGAFVIAGALSLSAASFSLAIRHQMKDFALLLAAGVPRKVVRRVALTQGWALSLVGAALGVPGGVGFAWTALAVMRRLMPPDLGFDAMQLHPDAGTIVIGSLASAALAMGAALFALRSLKRLNPVLTLRGGQDSSILRRGLVGPRLWILASIPLFAIGPWQGPVFGGILIGSGTLAIIFGMAGAVLATPPKVGRPLGWARLAARQIRDSASTVMPGAVLAGLAAFVLCLVASHLRMPSGEDHRLLVTTSIPTSIDFSSESGRRSLGLDDEELRATKGMKVMSFLRSPGDDVSCLNPGKAIHPRTLGVPLRTPPFHPFRANPSEAWEILNSPTPAGEPVSALADSETVEWTFESGLGKSIPWRSGRDAKFVGLLEAPGLSRDILVSEADFRKEFGDTSPSFFIVDPLVGAEAAVAKALTRALSPLGPTVRPLREEAAAVQGVQNAYMTLFLGLGMLGLVLGVVGTAFVSVREALARKSRLAILRAMGLTRAKVGLLAAAPGLASAILGVATGAFSAWVASPFGFALAPVCLASAAILLALATVNLLIVRSWTGADLVQELRCE